MKYLPKDPSPNNYCTTEICSVFCCNATTIVETMFRMLCHFLAIVQSLLRTRDNTF